MNYQDELRARLAAIRRRWYGAALLRAAGRTAAAAALPLAAGALAARLIQPTGGSAIALAAATLAVAAVATALVIRRTGRRPDDCQVARFVEERTAVAEVTAAACEADVLVSAVEIVETPGRHAGGFSDLIVASAVRALRDVEPQSVVPAAVLRRAMLQAAGGAAALAIAIALAAPAMLRAGGQIWLALFPGTVQISVQTGDGRVKAGDAFVIVARIDGAGAALSRVAPQLKVSADGQERTVAMAGFAGGPATFVYRFDSVDRSFKYAVSVGRVTSPTYSVTALFPPRVQRIDLQYEYPAFTGLGPRTETDGGDVYGPAGTKVRLIVQTDKPIATGALAMADGAPVPLQGTGDRAAADLLLAKDNTYRVTLKDRDGLESAGEMEYFIRVMDDRPPDVRIVRPSADQGITPLEEVAIEARADDDYGVAAMDLVYAVAGRAPRTIPFTRTTGTEVAKIGAHTIFAEELRVQPGDVITYYARARDVPRGKRSTETRSDIFFLEVKPFNEEFVSAESQASAAGAAGTQVDALISAQKEIINATWNLERRATAGRSAADMKAVGQAQAELKARVEQMMGGGRRGGRGGIMPQRIAQLPRQSQGASDPIAAAVEAMGKAVEQLAAEKTADALPHEMAALQGLLQAQAEIRRRQVGQSSSASGQGGSNRADRDLSALFDRELQRQQRTNYETPRSATEQTQPQDRNSDAADRVRDLARRQAELARQQRELSQQTPSAEEARRQLARLQREQEDLQRQLETLERELRARQSEDAARSKSGQQPSQGNRAESGNQRSAEQNARDMRRVADQMRTASGEMQRQNAGGAAASAEKAAEALRQMEQQMRSGSADARRNDAGELQLEAQQIAGEQRRIADEAARLEQDAQRGGRTSDATRRLAAEKDRLADRVAELQRSTRQVANERSGDERYRAAARQMESERIAERMRASAQQAKQRAAEAQGGRGQSPSSQPTGAEADRQLARALESVAETLGGGAGGRRLSEELDRTREMRERLNRLEQNVRDAEARARASRGTPAPTGRQAPPNPSGDADQQAQRAREAYARELERSRESLRQMGAQQPRAGEGATPEQHEFSRSSPGNEAFKQDFSGWESLRKDVDRALEAYENAVAARHPKKLAEDRLSAGGSDRVPDRYQQRVSRYFESLAKGKK